MTLWSGFSSRIKGGKLASALFKVASTGLATLREIFDESAYQRFLDRKGLPSSIDAYAVFRQENEVATSRRPKCC